MFNQLKSLLVTDTGKDTSVVFGGTILNVLAGGLFFIFAPRILGAADYGLFSTVIGTGILATSIANFGIDTGILRFVKKGSADSKKYLSIAAKSYFILGIVVALAGLIVSPIIAAFLNQSQITNLLRIAFASTVVLLFTNLYVAGLQAERQFVKASAVNISSNLARLIILISAAAFLKADLLFMTLLFFLAPIVSVIVGQIYLKLKIEDVKTENLLTFHKYNFWIALTLIITSVPYDNYLLLKFSGPVQAGIYAAPFKILTFVHQFAGNYTRVLASRFTSFDTKVKARVFAIKSGAIVLLFAVGLLILAAVASPLVTLIFGEEFVSSVNVFRLLIIGFAFFFATTIPVSLILYYFGKSQVNFWLTLTKTVIFVVLLLILVDKYQALGAAMAFAISEAISFTLSASYAFFKLR